MDDRLAERFMAHGRLYLSGPKFRYSRSSRHRGGYVLEGHVELDDVLGVAMLRALRSPPFDPKRASLATWCERHVNRAYASAMRRHLTRIELWKRHNEMTVASDRLQRWMALTAHWEPMAYRPLPVSEAQRAALEAVRRYGSTREAAAGTGLAHQTIRNQVSMALKRLSAASVEEALAALRAYPT